MQICSLFDVVEFGIEIDLGRKYELKLMIPMDLSQYHT